MGYNEKDRDMPTTPIVKQPENPRTKDVAGSTNKTSPKKPEPIAAKPEQQNQNKQFHHQPVSGWFMESIYF